MAGRPVSIALERYDRHIPFFMGAVEPPPGIDLQALEVGMVPPRRDGVDRHKRALVDLEFDIAEVSLASYILARQRGVPLTAVPCAPRRLFSQNHIFVGTESGITHPSQLSGKRIAIWAFQVTMSVLAKGDLQSEYGLAWRDVTWVTQRPEEIESEAGAGHIERMPEGRTGADMLLAGAVEGYIDPHPPEEIFEDPRVRRLFEEPQDECRKYWDKYHYYPVMHLLALKDDLIAEFPDFPRRIMDMWDEARDQSYEFYVDHNYTVLPFGRYAYQDDRETFNGEFWPSGFGVNKENLEKFIDYMVDQELLRSPVPVESLFHESVLET